MPPKKKVIKEDIPEVKQGMINLYENNASIRRV
jgi:hypothetical protein